MSAVVTTLIMFFFVKSPSSALKMETADYSETLASANQSTRRLNPKELYLNEYNLTPPLFYRYVILFLPSK
jgi:hypothetical protein